LATFPDLVEIPVSAYHAAEIPGEVIRVEIPAAEFPAQVMATSQALVIPVGEIPGLAFPVEAFLVRNVAEVGDFAGEFRTVVNHRVAYQQVLVVRGGATEEAGH